VNIYLAGKVEHTCWRHTIVKGLRESLHDVTSSLCLEAIEDADLVFAWINSNDCYGTIAELGYAKGQGKLIAIAGPHKIHDMWFVYEMADMVLIPADDPKSALETAIPRIITAKKFRDI
jgi:nucleoside 2-deoxyribosyltransferase